MDWRARMAEDIQSVFNHDPAAKNRGEVVLTYPGLHAIWLHRIAHRLYNRNFFTLARFTSHLTRFLTGIEIHPGARLGRRVFIDHGMGIVIGETAEIGDDCLLYKGVVLGGTTLEKKKRHPTLGKGVVVGSNACILGAILIGDGARIGSGSVVVRPVPAGATVVGVPAKVVKRAAPPAGPEGDLRNQLQHADMPDPLIELLVAWTHLLKKYEARIQRLEAQHQFSSPNLVEAFRRELPFLENENDEAEAGEKIPAEKKGPADGKI